MSKKYSKWALKFYKEMCEKIISLNCVENSMGEGPTFFMNFSGHVHSIVLHCYPKGFDFEGPLTIFSDNFYIGKMKREQDYKQALEKADDFFEEVENARMQYPTKK